MRYLLTESSAKLDKSQDDNTLNAIMYLDPKYNKQVCPFATVACRRSCLEHSGRLAMEPAQRAMHERTELYFNDHNTFMMMLKGEIAFKLYEAKKQGKKLAIRLNGTSDMNFKEIYETFKEVQFYEYTKSPKIAKMYHKLENVHYTFSRSEETKLIDIFDLLTNGINVAIVFDDKKPMPTTWNGYRVIDGDKHDRRFEDPTGVIIGLKLKGNKEDKQEARDKQFAI